MTISIVLLAVFASVQPITMNVFVPSLPGVATDLGASLATVQLTVSLYLATFGIVQLVYGPLSDRFGRKPTLLAALAVLGLGSLACALAPSISWLVAGRMVQAAGACGGAVITRAILRDLHGRDGTARSLGSMTAFSAVASAFAPALGGALDVAHGWRAGFLVVGALALALFIIAWRVLPETNAHRGTLTVRALIEASRVLGRSRPFVGYTLHVACAMGSWMTVVTGFPHILGTLVGAPPTEYGKWFPLLTAGYIAGNLVTARLAGRLQLESLVLLGAVISMLAVAGGVVLVHVVGPHPAALFMPITLMVFGQGISQQSGIAAAVSIEPRIAGSASGLLGAVQMLAGACAAQLVAPLLGASALPLLLMALLLVVLGCGLGWWAGRR